MAPSASHFPDALVRHLPDILQMLNQRQLLCPGRGDRSEKVISHLIGGIDQLPEDVELQLSGRGVADANRGCAVIAWQPRHVPFLQLSFARKAIHDLDLVRTAGHAALQPSPPRLGFLQIAGGHQGGQSERGVAHPAVAVVPIAVAPELLRQRRGGSGDDSAGGRIGQRFQGQQGALHRLSEATGVRALGGPVTPEHLGRQQSAAPVHRRRYRQMGRAVRKDEGHALSFDDVELRNGCKFFAL